MITLYSFNTNKTLAREKKMCLWYNKKQEVSYRNKNLYSMEKIFNNPLFKGVYFQDNVIAECMTDSTELYLKDAGYDLHMWCEIDNKVCIASYRNSMTYTHLKEEIERLRSLGINSYEKSYKLHFLKLINDNQYFSKLDLKLAEIMSESEEFINAMLQSKENYRKIQDEKSSIRDAEHQAKRDEELKVRTEKFNSAIDDAENKIRNNENVSNAELENVEGKDISLLLTLFRKYNIDIPLKTQGWIKKALSEITFNGEKVSYRYYSSSKNSTVFANFLNKLIYAIKNPSTANEPVELE